MNYLLRSVIRNICLFYLDDIIVFSKTKEEHFINLEHILDLLKEADFKLGLSKCKFMSESVQYLGHVISAKGITPDPEKMEQFKNYKRPTTIVEIQSFLGLASYYRRFIKIFADIAHPLIELTKKKKDEQNKLVKKMDKEEEEGNKAFEWGEAEQKAFETLRDCLITPPIVSFPDCEKEF
jgi:hypothetical protein